MKLLTSLTLAFGIAMSGSTVLAQGVINGETLNEGSSSHATLSAISAVLEQSGNGVIQIQSGQTLTKSLLNIALGRTTIGTIPTAAYMLLGRGAGPYKDLGEQGATLAGNVQAIIGFQPGLFVPIVFEDSGIESWEDMKGKKIFTGPPSGTAAVNTRTMIEAVTGFKAGEDYEEVVLDWAAAQQAMLDRKFDVFVIPAAEPDALVQQLASAGGIRILGVPEDVYTGEVWKESAERTGTTEGLHGTSAYDTGVTYVNADANGNLHLMAFTFGIMVNKAMPEDQAYNVTKAILDGMDRIEVTAAFMPNLRLREHFVGIASTPGLKLHPGAIRAYEEAGIEVPAGLR
jgi:TRAP transporter TAXI family solute receptor